MGLEQGKWDPGPLSSTPTLKGKLACNELEQRKVLGAWPSQLWGGNRVWGIKAGGTGSQAVWVPSQFWEGSGVSGVREAKNQDTWVLPSSGKEVGSNGLEQQRWEPENLGSILTLGREWSL